MLALPSEKAAEIALRTQQVIMEETGVANVADPLGGSWYVEALTDEHRAPGRGDLRPDQGHGRRDGARSTDAGILRGIEDGWFTGEIAEAAFRTSGRWRRATRRSSASTPHGSVDAHDLEILRVSHEVELEQVRELADRRQGRATTPPSRGRSQRMVEVAPRRRRT